MKYDAGHYIITKILWCKQIIVLLAAVLALAKAGLCATQYVDFAASGADSGNSWANAYTNLQSALAVAVSNDQIWVAKGSYYPADGTSRSVSFCPARGVLLYGGFTNGMTSLVERNWTSHVTALSGDTQRDVIMTNNSYHVLRATNNVTLDGFIITAGYADGASPDCYGGAIYCIGSHVVTLRNCSFTNNRAVTAGGALYHDSSKSLTIDDCRFLDNVVITGLNWYGGGAVFVSQNDATDTNTVVRDSVFIGNTVTNLAGQASAGGAFRMSRAPWRFFNCTFVSNTANTGGAIQEHWPDDGKFFMSNCVFVGNRATAAGSGGATYVTDGASPTFSDCIFVANKAAGYGEACRSLNANSVYCNCIFVGHLNVPVFQGGQAGGLSFLTNCLIAGNVGGLCSYGSTVEFRAANCTVADNYYSVAGAGIYLYQCHTATVENCIFWGNRTPAADNGYMNQSTCTVSYTAIEGGFTPASWSNVTDLLVQGPGNLTNDPLFADSVTGAWTSAGVYDPDTGKTLLTAAGAGWTVNEHARKTVNPQTNQYLQFYIVSNNTATATVWGDASALATNGGFYRIHDYHPQSRSGRWTALGWAKDAVDSPCIDAGNPASSYRLEPIYNGRRINMGVFGNTVEASISYLAGGSVFKLY